MENTKPLRINLGSFDLIKGIGLLVLVTAHILPRYDIEQLTFLGPIKWLNTLLGVGTNPMFYIVSGFSFREKPVVKMLKKSASTLLKPYFYVMLFITILLPLNHYVCYKLWPGAIEETIRTILAFLFGIYSSGKITLFGYSLHENSVVWFLLALFIAQNILNLVLKVKDERVQLVLVVCCVLVGYGLAYKDVLYFCLPKGLLAVGHCYAGYMLRKHNYFANSKAKIFAYTFFALLIVYLLFFKDINLPIKHHGLLVYVVSMCAGIAMTTLGIYAGRLEWKGLDWIKRAGVYTYWLICVHSVEMTCIRWYRLTNYFADRQIIALIIEICAKVFLFTSTVFVFKQIVKRKYRRKLGTNGK